LDELPFIGLVGAKIERDVILFDQNHEILSLTCDRGRANDLAPWSIDHHAI
jgi:hypothetical protein